MKWFIKLEMVIDHKNKERREEVKPGVMSSVKAFTGEKDDGVFLSTFCRKFGTSD